MRKSASIYRRRGSINTEDESDLFECSDTPEPSKPTGPTKKGRKRKHELIEPQAEAEGDDNDDNYKIMIEANMYKLLGEYEKGLEGMRVNFDSNKCYTREQCQELKNQIWIKGEWVLSGTAQRFKMEYQKQKDFSEEIHGHMIATIKEIIRKREEDKTDQSEEKEQEENNEKQEHLDIKENQKEADIIEKNVEPSNTFEKTFLIWKRHNNFEMNNGVYEGFYEHEGKRNKEKIVLENTISLSVVKSPNGNSYIKRSIKTVGYGENNMGFFMLEGCTEIPKSKVEKMVYFESYNKETNYSEDEEYESGEKQEDRDLKDMESYLNKKRLLCLKISKLKLVRSYIDKPEIKKRRKREKKEVKIEDEINEENKQTSNNIKIPILPEHQMEDNNQLIQNMFPLHNQQKEQQFANQYMQNNIMYNAVDIIKSINYPI